jgi:hypothetical protein
MLDRNSRPTEAQSASAAVSAFRPTEYRAVVSIDSWRMLPAQK